MLVSYKWLKELVDFDMAPSELDNVLTMLGIEVEAITDYKEKYKGFVIAEVSEHAKHPDADKLSLCSVNYGSGNAKVICGAPNVAAGQKVVLGMTGAVVPQGGFKIERRKIRGTESEGMICSRYELEYGEDHSGIWVLPADAPIGTELAEYLGMDDIIFDVSLTPNRADCLSHIGIAREIAAYTGNPLKEPKINLVESDIKTSDLAKVIIQDPEKCPRYTARVIKGVKLGESPNWLKEKLLAVGMRPINSIVDITNFVMMECGQPLHAFDLDELNDNTIIIKTASENEEFTTLDSKPRKLNSEMLMISDSKRSVAIAGVMGGENSEISDKTKDILLESACFLPRSVRKTSKVLAIQSESSYRFERGADIERVVWASDRAAQLIAEITGGSVCSGIIDEYPEKQQKINVKLRYARVNKIIGIDITDDRMKEMLIGIQFKIIEENSDYAIFEVPSFRVDIFREIYLAEEIARLYNYDNIESQFASEVNFGAQTIPQELSVPKLKNSIRSYLVNSGYNEIITQNMMDPKTAQLFDENLIHIANPLGEELSVMRPSLLPSMLRVIEKNCRAGNEYTKMFEIGKTFRKTESKETFVPGIEERKELIIALSGSSLPLHWESHSREFDFFDIKGAAEAFFELFRFSGIKMKPMTEEHPHYTKNSLAIWYKKEQVGCLGALRKELLKKFDVEKEVFVAEFNMSILYKADRVSPYYRPVSPYPKSVRDLAFVVSSDTAAESLRNEILNTGGKYLQQVKLFDVYQGKNISSGKKSLAYSLSFSAADRTLTDKDSEAAIKKIIQAVEKKFEAKLREF